MLTSHSPFLVSDLPKQCLTVMTRDAATTEGHQLEDQTLAGNLYRIYENPFSINIMETSAFASRKIREIEHDAKNGLISKESYDQLLEKAKLIGDEILRRSVENTIEKRFKKGPGSVA